MQESLDGPVPGDDRTEGDDEHYDNARKVFNAPIPVGKAPVRLSPGQRERGPQWHRGRRVAEVVDRVGEETHAPRKPGDADLDRRGDRKCNEGPLDRPDASFRRGDGRVDHAVGMNMPAVAMPVVMAVIVPMVVVLIMLVMAA